MEPTIRVLHIDDEPDFGELVKLYVERETDQISVICQSDTRSALEILDDEAVDCIVSDYEMPHRNGIEFLNVVRDRGITAPFILYTGKGSEEIASEAITAGVSDYLQKESTTDHYKILVNRIQNLVSKHRTERAVEETKRFYEGILSRSSDYVIIVDQRGNIEYSSSAAERVIGYSGEELSEMDPFSLVVEADRDDARQFVQKAGSPDTDEVTDRFRFIHKNGSSIWIESRARDLRDVPPINGILINARDVSDTVLSEQQSEAIVNNLPGYVYRHRNEEGWPLEFVKGSSSMVTGYTTDGLEAQIRDAEEIIHPDDRQKVRDATESCKEQGDRYDVTYRIITKSGEIRRIRDQGHLVEETLSNQIYLDGYVTVAEPRN